MMNNALALLLAIVGLAVGIGIANLLGIWLNRNYPLFGKRRND